MIEALLSSWSLLAIAGLIIITMELIDGSLVFFFPVGESVMMLALATWIFGPFSFTAALLTIAILSVVNYFIASRYFSGSNTKDINDVK